eukprot:1158412-Pelagomonas_calceolata.AAC.4
MAAMNFIGVSHKQNFYEDQSTPEHSSGLGFPKRSTTPPRDHLHFHKKVIVISIYHDNIPYTQGKEGRPQIDLLGTLYGDLTPREMANILSLTNHWTTNHFKTSSLVPALETGEPKREKCKAGATYAGSMQQTPVWGPQITPSGFIPPQGPGGCTC